MRRQNSSCDQCRRAKRKCFVSHVGDIRDPGRACLNCQRLARICTFDFVEHAAQRRRTRPISAPKTSARQEDARSQSSTPSDGQRPGHERAVHHQKTPSYFYQMSASEPDSMFTDGLDLFDDFGGLDALECPGSSTVSWPSSEVEVSSRSIRSSKYCLTPTTLSSMSSKSLSTRMVVPTGSWSGSPTRLLNSTFNNNLVGYRLNDIYRSMMRGMEDRYLAHTCNPFATSRVYKFDESEEFTTFPQPENSAWRQNESSELAKASEAIHNNRFVFNRNFVSNNTNAVTRSIDRTDPLANITLVGLIQFLDHFGDFYGNKFEKRDRQGERDLLVAAQQTYALQWSTATDRGPQHPQSPSAGIATAHRFAEYDVFTTAWFDLKSRLVSAEGRPSFQRVYACKLFDMTSAPSEAVDAELEKRIVFDQALHQFLYLKNLVETYCANLDASSAYRTLLESCLRIFYWFTFFKDTMATVISSRNSVLLNTHIQPLEQSRGPLPRTKPDSSHNDTSTASALPATAKADLLPKEETFAVACQNAALYAFRLFQQIVDIKSLLGDDSLAWQRSNLQNAYNTGVSIIESFKSSYESFCFERTEKFLQLARDAQLSFGYMILFWNLAVLSLVEQVQRASDLGAVNAEFMTGRRVKDYEASAVKSGSLMARNIVALAKGGPTEVAGSTTFRLPFISQHANAAPIVEVLVKTISNTIRRHVDHERDDLFQKYTNENNTEVESISEFFASLKALLSCLLELETTLGGTLVVRRALDRLMIVHGDILMECWSATDPDIV